ncbi:MAG: helix-hairpin-helix domain-containing protein [Bacteroidetes bacterium]|nr:helix-hairpin-helix domain-containing protein [Bacteroidota bacterium]
MNFFRSLFAACSLASAFWPDSVRAQSSEDEIREENFLEAVLTSSDDVPEMFETIDLNEASMEELLSIAGVDSKYASSILEYRRKVRVIHKVDELSRLNGATPAALAAIRQRARISEEFKIHVEATSYSSASPQTLPLYQDAYSENGLRNFQRLDLRLRNYELCMVTDKDPGEKSYLDFYSLAAAARSVSIFSTVNIGNYRLSMGNGMLFSNGGVVSKSAEAITPLFNKSPYSLKLYRSRGETRYLRGAAFEIPVGKFGLTGFVSSKKFKAHLDSTGSVTSIDYSGLNLPTGGPSGGGLHETIEGGILQYGSDWGVCGISGAYLSYDRPFSNYYVGKQFVVNMFLRVRADGLAFSGEVMADKSVSFSTNVGIDYERARFAVGLRDLRSRIVSNYGGALSEGFPSSPEQGIYFGAWLRPTDEIKLGFYYDRFRIISLSNTPDRNGEEIFADCYLALSRLKLLDGNGTLVYLRYKYKTKEDYYIPESDFPAAQSSLAGSRQTFRVELRHVFSRTVSIRTRLEKNFLSSGEKGELFVFDCTIKTSRLSISPRASFYKTDSYNSAFYVVEGDLPGVAMYTLLYGDGARMSLSANWKVTDFFSIGAKISRDIYDGDKEVTVESSSRRIAGITTISLELSCVID